MMLFVVIALSASAVMGYIVFKLGFHIGNQIGQTQHVREHLQKTRPERQTISSQQVG